MKWFLHSLEGCEMLRREAGRVTAALVFNTVRRDRRERTYVLSEEGFARLVSATGEGRKIHPAKKSKLNEGYSLNIFVY